MAIPKGVVQEVEKLRREIERHNRLYYAEDAPAIPDADYDALFRKLLARLGADALRGRIGRNQRGISRLELLQLAE